MTPRPFTDADGWTFVPPEAVESAEAHAEALVDDRSDGARGGLHW